MSCDGAEPAVIETHVFPGTRLGLVMPSETLLNLPHEMQQEVIMHLQPRFLYRLAQTSRHFFLLFKSEKYWARVALHLASRTTLQKHYLIMGSQGYKRSMDVYIEEVRTHISRLERHGKAAVGLSKLPTWKWIDHFPDPYPMGSSKRHMGDPGMFRVEPSHCLRTAKYLIEDPVGRNIEMRALMDKFMKNPAQGTLPVVDGSFISAKRRGHRATARFLQTVDDAQSLTLRTKRMLVDLAKDMLENRATYKTQHENISFQSQIDSLVKDELTQGRIWRGFAMLNMDIVHLRGNTLGGNLVLDEANMPKYFVEECPLLFYGLRGGL